MKYSEFENLLKDKIIEAYVTVYGEEKWNGLTNKEKDEVLHIAVESLAKRYL